MYPSQVHKQTKWNQTNSLRPNEQKQHTSKDVPQNPRGDQTVAQQTRERQGKREHSFDKQEKTAQNHFLLEPHKHIENKETSRD